MQTKNTVKRMLALTLSLLLVFAIAIPAFADGYTITINNADGLANMERDQFTAYQIFKGTVQTDTVDTGNGTTGKMTDVQWADNAQGSALLDALKGTSAPEAIRTAFASATTAIHVAEVLEAKADDGAFLQAFAKIAKDYLGAGAKSTAAADGRSSTINVAEKGYYLIVQNTVLDDANEKDGVYSSFILQVINADTAVTLKADIPSVTKTANDNHAGIDDIVKFTLTAKLPKNFADYTKYYLQFKDTLSSGLQLVNDTDHPMTVSVVNGSTTKDMTKDDAHYTVDTTGAGTNAFTVTIDNLKDAKYTDFSVTKDSTITVTYYAKVLSTAANVENNKVDLTYSNNPNVDTSTGTTVEDIEYVHNYNVNITKKGTDGKDLENAEFYLTKTVDDKTYYATADTTGNFTGWVEMTGEDAPQGAKKFVSDSSGKIAIKGLDAGKYTLIEATAPTGYGKIADVEFEIKATLSKDGATVTTVSVEILGEARTDATVVADTSDNTKHTVALLLTDPTESNVPNTGGIGTIIFYVMGGLMVIGAGAYLVVSKKKAQVQ